MLTFACDLNSLYIIFDYTRIQIIIIFFREIEKADIKAKTTIKCMLFNIIIQIR